MRHGRHSAGRGVVATLGAAILGLVATSPATAQTASSPPPRWRRRSAATS